MAGLRLIVGLGNPGAEYARTRHNAGFWFVDALSEQCDGRWGVDSRLHSETAKVDVGEHSLLLLKPRTYMNAAGRAFCAALRYWKLDPAECLVVHDDLDLDPGVARLKFDGGHGGQNGLRDIAAHLGHGRHHRLRIGIGHPGDKHGVTPWVLGRPGRVDEEAIRTAVDAGLRVLPLMLANDFNEAMKRLHTKRT